MNNKMMVAALSLSAMVYTSAMAGDMPSESMSLNFEKIKASPKSKSGTGQPGNIASNAKPDITTHGITLNGNFISGGPVTTVSADQAKSKVNGQCRFQMAYHMINKGDVTTSPAFSNRLLRNGALVVQHNHQTLAAKQSVVKTFDVFLKPGMNDFGLYLDAAKQVAESKETNNFRVARIKLTGSCAGRAGSSVRETGIRQ